MFLSRILFERNFIVHYVAFARSLTGLWSHGNISTRCWMLFAGLCGIAAHGVDVHVHWGLIFWTPKFKSVAQTGLSAIWKNTSEFV